MTIMIRSEGESPEERRVEPAERVRVLGEVSTPVPTASDMLYRPLVRLIRPSRLTAAAAEHATRSSLDLEMELI